MTTTKVKTKGGNAGASIRKKLDNSVYVNPLTDFGFKRLFYNKELLTAFLNDIIGTDIKDIQYQPNEALGWYYEERTAIFDLLCTLENDEYVVVEMQMGNQAYFCNRAIFYSAHMIRKQAPRGKYWDYNLKAVYIVSILNFTTFKEKAAKTIVIERASIYREVMNVRLSDKLQMIFIELPKFKKKASELQNNTDTWLYLLKNTFGLKACPQEITGEIFKLFLEIAEKKQLTTNEMDRYAVSLERSYQMRNIANYERMEGKTEGKTEVAIRLLKMNEPIDKVVYLTDLSHERVKALLRRLPKSKQHVKKDHHSVYDSQKAGVRNT
jgi:predicted transposase/invertase (TIGR01784 family)